MAGQENGAESVCDAGICHSVSCTHSPYSNRVCLQSDTDFPISSFIGTIVLMTVENTNKATQVGLLISYYITLSFWSAQTLSLSLISRNIAGQTKKSTVVAANFIAWATGNAIGKSLLLFPTPSSTFPN